MATMVNYEDEIIRISPKDSRKIEVSKNDGRNWSTRYHGSNTTGDFENLMVRGDEILAQTSTGLFRSTNEGRNWSRRSR